MDLESPSLFEEHSIDPAWKAGWEACRKTLLYYLACEEGSAPRPTTYPEAVYRLSQFIEKDALEKFFDDV